MPEPTILDLVAEDGRALRHKYYQQEAPPAGLLITFPGDNYGTDGPLLYYPSQLLRGLGWDTVGITYGYQSAGEPFSPLAIAAVLSECRRAVSRFLAERDYPRLVLAGKSLGASLIALLCQDMQLPDRTQAVYLTPPLGPMFDPVFLEANQEALLALGTADRFFDAGALEHLQGAKEFHLVVIQEADHSMNIKGDLDASLGAVQRVTQEVIAFITSTNAG